MADAAPFDELGLLAGLDGPAREERVQLLEWLRDEHQLSEEALVQSTFNGTIVLAGAGRRLGTGERYSAADVAREAGVSVDLWTALVRAIGLPTPPDLDVVFYSEAHLNAARSLKRFIDGGVSSDQLVNVTRVLGRGLAQAADLMRQTVLELVLTPGLSEIDLAKTYAAASEGLAPLLAPLVDQMLLLHLHNAVRDEIVNDTERKAGALPGARDVSVAFADLVGFTKLGEQLTPGELEHVADQLVMFAGEVIDGPVRLVKSVGDAVLLVSPEPLALVEVAFALMGRVEAQGQGFPMVRIGVAQGPAVARAGDWFGRPVNLASRITGVARAGSIVTDAAIREAIGDGNGVRWSSIGERRLKGISSPVRLFRARQPGLGGLTG